MLGQLLSGLGTAAVRAELDAVVGKIKLRAVLLAGAGVLWLLAAGFALAALAIWLSGVVGPIPACLILSGSFALIGLGLYLWQAQAKRQATPLASVLSRALAPLKEAAEAHATAEPAAADTPEASPPADAAREAGSLGAIMVLAAFGYAAGRTLTGR